MQQRFGDQRCPSGLVSGAQSRAVVGMEVLVEQDVVPPPRIVLKERNISEDRSLPSAVAQEQARESIFELLCSFIKRYVMTTPGGQLHGLLRPKKLSKSPE